jgi:hypothetical protein
MLDPEPTLTAAGHGSLTALAPGLRRGRLDDDGQVPKVLPLVLSSDSHVFEPPDLWQTRIDVAFRDRAPRIERIDGTDQIVVEADQILSRIALRPTRVRAVLGRRRGARTSAEPTQATRRQGRIRGAGDKTLRDASSRASKAFYSALSLRDLIFSGVFERHPRLTVAIVEFELAPNASDGGAAPALDDGLHIPRAPQRGDLPVQGPALAKAWACPREGEGRHAAERLLRP